MILQIMHLSPDVFYFLLHIYKHCLTHLVYGNVTWSATPKSNRVRKHKISHWPLDHRVLSRSNTSGVLAVCLFAHMSCSCFVSWGPERV